MYQKKTKRAICLLISAAMLASGLASCSGGEQGSSEASSQDASAEITYNGSGPIAEETVTLSVLTTNGASQVIDYENMAWQQEILKRANVNLDMEMIDPSSYADVIKPRLAAAVDLPDIVQVGSNDQDMAYINSGIFLDLTSYYDQYGFNLKQRFKETPGLEAEITTPDDKIYYVPFIYLTVD